MVAGSTRAVGDWRPFAGVWLFHADRPDAPLRLEKGEDIAFVTVSPDGRWAATCRHPSGWIKVWDTRDGRLVKHLTGRIGTFPRFSPDGRWLAVSGNAGRLYAVGTWEPGLEFTGRAQFSPDSRLLAVSTGTGVVRLLDIATGEELVELEDPNQEVDYFHLFTPDGTRLLTASDGKEAGIHVWDLRAIRRRLQALGLDWDAPGYPPEPPPPQSPLRIEVVPK